MSLKKILSSSVIQFVLLASFGWVQLAYAADATLFLSPVTGTAAIGNTFGVQVMVASGGMPLNAVEGKLTFDPTLLEVQDATTSDSALTSWTTPPSIDNKKGEVVWSGIVSKSITGDRLPLFRLTLKGHRAGEAPLQFETGGAVLAADGSGTNVLTSMHGGIYVITPQEVLPKEVGGADISLPLPAQPREMPPQGEVLGAATGTNDRTRSENFIVTLASREDATDPSVAFLITATSTRSGVDHFTFALDAESPVEWRDDGTHRYLLSHVPPGKHTLEATMYERTGSTTLAHVEFSVDPLPPPEIGLTATEAKEGGYLGFVGKTIPQGVVQIFLARAGEDPFTEEVTAGADGAFAFTSVLRLSPGIYEYWAQVNNVHGAVSQPTPHVGIPVSTTIWGLLGRHPIIPVFVVVLLLLIVGMVFVIRRAKQRPIDTDEGDGNEIEPTTIMPQKIPHAQVSGGVVRLTSFEK